MRFEKILIPAGLLIALCAAAAGAQTISAPPAVLADGDGAFAYTVEMTYPPSGASFGGYTIYSVENISEGTMFIDGFCMSWVDGGSSGSYEVAGTLADPTLQGRIDLEWFICEPYVSLYRETLILPQSVEAEAETWSSIKSIYR